MEPLTSMFISFLSIPIIPLLNFSLELRIFLQFIKNTLGMTAGRLQTDFYSIIISVVIITTLS